MRKLIALSIVLLIILVAQTGVTNSFEEIFYTSMSPPMSHTDAIISFEGDSVYMASILGPCDADNTSNCAQYTYTALYSQMANVDVQLSLFDILAITYYGELSHFHLSGNSDDAMASYEAITRSFFDKQSGACLYEGTYFCAYPYLIRWLSTMQHWTDAAVQEDDVIRINTYRLLGLHYYDVPTTETLGYLGYDRRLYTNIDQNIALWHTGQGYDVPSSWGNTTITTSEELRRFQNNDEIITIATFYIYDGITLVNESDSSYGEPNCILLAVITTLEGRLARDELTVC